MTATPNSRSETGDRTRGLLRAVSDSIKRLTSIYNSGKAIKTVFSYEAYGYRLRLKEALQKLMFISPVHTRRAEELIWRKVFYEPLHMYKVYVKNNDRADHVADFELALRMHLLSGVGFYQSLLLQLQSDCIESSRENLFAWLPVPFHIPTYDESLYEFESKLISPSVGEKMVQKCLMYLGDLFRYLIDFGEHVGKPLAYAYYNAALNFDTSMGLPHNQLGILDVGRCYGLNAIFHYLHCLCAQVPFEGARRNLLTVLTKNEIRYRKLFGDKPIFGLYARRPNRYRPKDFRKTITKFIFLIQCFLTPKTDATRTHHPYVFQDTLFELHLMLNLSSTLTLEPDRQLNKDGLDDQSSTDGVELRGESSVFSEQLTGPIFVRLLMIALLVANLKFLEQSRTKAKAAVEDLPSTPTSSEVIVPDSPTDSTQSETSNDRISASEETDEASSYQGLSEPFGPLSFILQLSELFMSHISTQLDQHLTTRELADSCAFDNSIKDIRFGPSVQPEQPICSESGTTSAVEEQQPQVHEEESGTDLSDDVGPSLRMRTRKGPSANSLERNGGTEGEEEEDEEEVEDDELEYSEEADLSADLWSSDDSSPFHSQDDMGSSALSSDENEDYRSDHRLRRVRLSSGVTKRSARSGQTTEPGAKVNTAAGNTILEPLSGTTLPLGRKDNRTEHLDPITEEESLPKNRRGKMDRTARRQADGSDNDASATSGPPSTTGRHQHYETRYSKRKMNRAEKSGSPLGWSHDAMILEDTPETRTPVAHEDFSAETEDPSVELSKRASLISRLYLLASVKTVLDWIQTDHFGVLRCLPHLDADSSLPEHTVMQYVIQRWCTQLTLLLNQLYPLFKQTSNEASHATDSVEHAGSHDKSLVNPNSSLVQLLSAFGVHALESSFHLASEQNKSADTEASTPSDHSHLIRQTFPLPEDWLLRGLPCMDAAHHDIDFSRAFLTIPFTRLDEAVLRVTYLVSAGQHLAQHAKELGVQFTFEPSQTPVFQSFIPGGRNCMYPTDGIHNVPWSTVPHQHPRRRRARYSGGAAYTRGGGRRGEFVAPGQGRARWNTKGAYKRGGHSFAKYSSRPGRFEPGWNECSPQPRRASRRHKTVIPEASVSGPGDAAEDNQFPQESRSRAESEERIDVSELPKQSSNSSLPVGVTRDVKADGEEGACDNDDTTEVPVDLESRRTQLMRDMARLRLLNEVDQLARQCVSRSPQMKRSTTGTNVPPTSTVVPEESSVNQVAAQLSYDVSQHFVSPYLVVDAFCLASHLPAVKQLVNSGSFVVIIPVAVIAHLDYLKKTMATARVAIRYLEQETHSGNRFLRLQRPEEQPKEPTQTLRLVSAKSSVASNLADLESEEDSAADTARSASPRVVKRWLSILGCATYFSELKSLEQTSPSSAKNESDEAVQQQNDSSTNQRNASTLVNNPTSCCDLLTLNRTPIEVESEPKAALVTILIGSRDTQPQDTIVPREYLSLVYKSGVRLELIRDFLVRWRKTRSTQPRTFSEEDA